MSEKKKKVSGSNGKIAKLKSDGLFKSVFGTKLAAREFLEEHLPASFRKIVDLRKVEIDRESYVEEDLKRRLSDIVYRVGTKGNISKGGINNAFIYCLIDHTSTNDYLMPYRVWKYTMLLLDRYIQDNKIDGKKRVKLPLVFPLVVYGGKRKYTAARNFWELFEQANMAREALGGDHALLDLESISDDDIRKDHHIAIVQYMIKHIRDRDLVKVWENMFSLFSEAILLDSKREYIYIKKLLWYSDAKLEKGKEQEIEGILKNNLKQEGEKIVKTVADKYREEAKEETSVAIAIKMLSKNKPEEEISEFTDLTIEQINKLKSK